MEQGGAGGEAGNSSALLTDDQTCNVVLDEKTMVIVNTNPDGVDVPAGTVVNVSGETLSGETVSQHVVHTIATSSMDNSETPEVTIFTGQPAAMYVID